MLEFVHRKVMNILLVCHHWIAYILWYSKRDDNPLTFVRFASCVMIRNDKHNTYSFLHRGRQFVNELGDAFEVEVVGWKNSYLEKRL